MKEDKIKWCLMQKKGIELIGENLNLSNAYIKEADITLENVFLAKGKWKVIMGYYAAYNAVYSLFMRTGVKCEIHDCTISLLEIFGFDSSDINFIEDLKKDRVDSQYYLKDIKFSNEKKLKDFIIKCKMILSLLNKPKIDEIRNEIYKKKKEIDDARKKT